MGTMKKLLLKRIQDLIVKDDLLLDEWMKDPLNKELKIKRKESWAELIVAVESFGNLFGVYDQETLQIWEALK